MATIGFSVYGWKPGERPRGQISWWESVTDHPIGWRGTKNVLWAAGRSIVIASPGSHGGLQHVKSGNITQQRAGSLEGSWCVGDNFLTQLMRKLMRGDVPLVLLSVNRWVMGCLQAILGIAIMKWESSILRKLWRGVSRKAIWTSGPW